MTGIPITLQAESLSKRFGRIMVFRNISLFLKGGESLSLTGPNGSGKSTLLEVLAQIQRPTAGEAFLAVGGERRTGPRAFGLIGFAGPRLQLYGELTGLETVRFARESRGCTAGAEDLLPMWDLALHGGKRVKHYSSGMKQRLKLLLAFMGDPPVLLLDEPCSNLDAQGRDLLRSRVESARKKSIIVIATNDEAEASLCRKRVSLG